MKTLFIVALMLCAMISLAQQKAWIGKIDNNTYFETVHKTPTCSLAPANAELVSMPKSYRKDKAFLFSLSTSKHSGIE
jgi:hypothetical protein